MTPTFKITFVFFKDFSISKSILYFSRLSLLAKYTVY